MKNIAIILAGGKGERLWPRSRDNFPKQFLTLVKGRGSLLQETVKRISSLVDIKDIYIVTGSKYINIVSSQLKGLPKENIICEPMGRNTSPAIELASIIIKEKYKDVDPVSFILPSDHTILDEKNYINTLKKASKEAEKGYLVTLGITPTGPDTGYGYIKAKHNSNDVEKFVEKPDLNTAKKYVKDGHYFWNSGMFIWKLSSILNAFNKYIKPQHDALIKLNTFKSKKDKEAYLNKIYPKLESISIDYAVMEKANNVKVIKSNFKWDDIGSWLSLQRINKLDKLNNYINGNVISIDSKNNIISSKDKLIATLGLENIVVIESKDAILIADKNAIKDIKNIRNILKSSKKDSYL